MIKSLITSDMKFLNLRGIDEIYASNAYRYSATCALSKNLLGFVKFFRHESAEELEHRTRLEEFANDMGDELDMPAIPAVEFKSEDVKSILNEIYKNLFESLINTSLYMKILFT
jgi:ferritin